MRSLVVIAFTLLTILGPPAILPVFAGVLDAERGAPRSMKFSEAAMLSTCADYAGSRVEAGECYDQNCDPSAVARCTPIDAYTNPPISPPAGPTGTPLGPRKSAEEQPGG